MKQTVIFSLLALAAGLATLPGRAADTVGTMDIRISGTVVANTTCTFSSHTGSVDFGEVSFSNSSGHSVIDASTSPKDLLALNCTGPGVPATVTLDAAGSTGTDSSGGYTVLKTSASGLGIRLLKDGNPANVGSALSFNTSAPPTLSVQLVQTSSWLSESRFRASGTLHVNFP